MAAAWTGRSTGVYGFPVELAARIAVQTIRSTPTTVDTIRLVAFDQQGGDALTAAVRG